VRSAERSAFALTAGDLSLLPLAWSDANELHALWTTPSVRRFLWDGETIPPELELLYGVDETFWGHGVACTIASAVIAYRGTDLKMRRIRATTDAANIRSVRVLEKLGFEFLEREMVAQLDTVFYELDACATAPRRA